MTGTEMLLALALLLGSLRALGLWRAHARVDVINVVVVGVLVQGRGRDLAAVLGGAGAGLYPEVARAIVEPMEKLLSSSSRELRARLERDAQRALAIAHRRLQAYAWLESLSIAVIVISGVWALSGQGASLVSQLGLLAATLLWFSNVRRARNIATQLVAGGAALIDTLLESAEQIREHAQSTEVTL